MLVVRLVLVASFAQSTLALFASRPPFRGRCWEELLHANDGALAGLCTLVEMTWADDRPSAADITDELKRAISELMWAA